MALEQASNPLDLLAVCGGDGTLQEVATALPNPPFPVALLPAGTANVLARIIGLPLDPLAALEIALRRKIQRIDIGVITGATRNAFLSMAGMGLDAHIAACVSAALKDRLGMPAYALSAIRALAAYDFPEFKVRVNREEVRAAWCLVANSRGYGGGLIFTPDADMCDGLFDVLTVETRSPSAYARILLRAWARLPVNFSEVRCFRADSLAIEGPSTLKFQADGEIIGGPPARIAMLPASFPLIIPEGAGEFGGRRGRLPRQ